MTMRQLHHLSAGQGFSAQYRQPIDTKDVNMLLQSQKTKNTKVSALGMSGTQVNQNLFATTAPIPAPQAPLTQEEKLLQHYLEHDIVGLSITSASAKSKYTTKFNVIRMHLTTMNGHPIVTLKDFFRQILRDFIKARQEKIEQNFSFY